MNAVYEYKEHFTQGFKTEGVHAEAYIPWYLQVYQSKVQWYNHVDLWLYEYNQIMTRFDRAESIMSM